MKVRKRNTYLLAISRNKFFQIHESTKNSVRAWRYRKLTFEYISKYGTPKFDTKEEDNLKNSLIRF
jgi:hypothetical protein